MAAVGGVCGHRAPLSAPLPVNNAGWVLVWFRGTAAQRHSIPNIILNFTDHQSTEMMVLSNIPRKCKFRM